MANQKDQDAGTRAGGDVVVKGASQANDEPVAEPRAGGDVVVKGPSQDPLDEGKRAVGDVVSKGASQS